MKSYQILIVISFSMSTALTAIANTQLVSQSEKSTTLSITGQDANALFTVFGKKEFKGFRFSLKNLKCSNPSLCTAQLAGSMYTPGSKNLNTLRPYITNFGVDLSPYFKRLTLPEQRVFISPREEYFFWEEHTHTKLFAELFKKMSKAEPFGFIRKSETSDYISLQLTTSNLDWTCYEYKNPRTKQQADEWIPHGAVLKSHDFKKTHLCSLASFTSMVPKKEPTFEMEIMNVSSSILYYDSNTGFHPLLNFTVVIDGCDDSFISVGPLFPFAIQKTDFEGEVNFSETYRYFYTDVKHSRSAKEKSLFCPTISIKIPTQLEIIPPQKDCKLDPRNYLSFFTIDANNKIQYVSNYIYKSLESTLVYNNKNSISIKVKPTKLNYIVAGDASKYNSETKSYDLEGIDQAQKRYVEACARK